MEKYVEILLCVRIHIPLHCILFIYYNNYQPIKLIEDFFAL